MMTQLSLNNVNELLARYESDNRSQRYAVVREYESGRNRVYLINVRKLSLRDYFSGDEERTFCLRLLEQEREKGILASFDLSVENNDKFILTFVRLGDSQTLQSIRTIIKFYLEFISLNRNSVFSNYKTMREAIDHYII